MNYKFDVELAKRYGVHEAIMLCHFEFWIFINRAKDMHFHDGRTWTYGTLNDFAEIWPFWSIHHIWRKLEKLVRQGVLVKGNFNKSGYDRTMWYAFKDEKSWFQGREHILQKCKMELTKSQNPYCEAATPIPNPIPNTSADKRQFGNSHKSDLDLGLKVEQDKAIAMGKNDFIDAVNRILRPSDKEATTFTRITKHLVNLCEAGKCEPDIFQKAIGWMVEAKTDGKRPKALFVAMIKERTGFKAKKQLLRGKGG